MKLASISELISTSGTSPKALCSSVMKSPYGPPSDVKEADVFGVLLDEQFAAGHIVAHESLEHLFGAGRVGHLDLKQCPRLRVHRGVPQFTGVHFTETLEPCRLDLGM